MSSITLPSARDPAVILADICLLERSLHLGFKETGQQGFNRLFNHILSWIKLWPINYRLLLFTDICKGRALSRACLKNIDMVLALPFLFCLVVVGFTDLANNATSVQVRAWYLHGKSFYFNESTKILLYDTSAVTWPHRVDLFRSVGTSAVTTKKT